MSEEPILDANGVPVEGTVYHVDSAGARMRCRLWRGYYVTDFEGAEARLERMRAEFSPRPDDLMICGYLKCGTHWLHDICHFLLTGQCESRPPNKENFMLEFEEHASIERFPSPRILNCHLPLPLLPQGFLAGPNKIVYALRNPKDVAVSLYHHCIGIRDYNYRSSFQAFLTGLFEPGRLDGGSYFGHTRGFLEALQVGSLAASRVHLVEFERLKADTAGEVRRLDGFLMGGAAGAELIDGICERVEFGQMKRDRGADMGHLFQGSDDGFYRKGGVGDWRNWFDPAGSAGIDALVERHLGEFTSLYRPTYEI